MVIGKGRLWEGKEDSLPSLGKEGPPRRLLETLWLPGEKKRLGNWRGRIPPGKTLEETLWRVNPDQGLPPLKTGPWRGPFCWKESKLGLGNYLAKKVWDYQNSPPLFGPGEELPGLAEETPVPAG